MPLRRSTIYDLEIVRFEPPELELALHVSSGTYVRAIADAIGGHCRTLRRTAVGPFRVEDADETRVVRSGRAVADDAEGAVALHHEGSLVAVARGDGRQLHPETVLPK